MNVMVSWKPETSKRYDEYEELSAWPKLSEGRQLSEKEEDR